MTVFLDTVGLIALWDETDQWHDQAQAAMTKLTAVRTDLATTSFVLLECANAAARRPYRSAVSRLRSRLEVTRRLIIPTESDWKNAWEAYEHRRYDTAGIVDHVSFAVMRRLGLSVAFTNDNHFAAAGFEILF